MTKNVSCIRQVGLVSAGCQPWNSNLVVGNGPRFAYCASLAVYIYEFDQPFGSYQLTSINAEHKQTILCISWNRQNPDLIATACSGNKILVWDITKRKVVAQLLNHSKAPPVCLDWMPFSSSHKKLSFSCFRGVFKTWDIETKSVETHKETFKVGVKMFRWHHKVPHKVAFGHADGSLTLLSSGKKYRHTLRPIHDEEECLEDPVVALDWDPLSNDYLLVGNKISGIRLIDSDGCFLVTTFSLPSRAVSTFTMSWIHSAPGMFLTGDRESGVLRLWTVSQNFPLDSFKIKQTGFNCLHVLDHTQNQSTNTPNGTASQNLPTNSSTQPGYSTPPASVVCAFVDGGIGLYNLQRKKWQFLRDYGHVETIFDCKFKPNNPRLLATASFDGTVKVWSVNDLTAERTSVGNEGVIYSISWAPGDLDCIVCGTRRNGVFVWDFNKEKVIKRFREHGTKSVFCVAWNQRDSHHIASCSEDSSCVIRRLDGEVFRKLHHPGAAYGCDWNLFDKNRIATGCEDGVVRVWDINTKDTKPKHKLLGHDAKVFHVKWNPLIAEVLCSGSDDKMIRVWRVTDNEHLCTAVLEGHTSSVRGLCWSFEIPVLLLSGSWDRTIRLWDVSTDSARCIEIVRDHGADIYGLTSHPMTPFTFASSSRDSTLRIWSLSSLFSNMLLKVVIGDATLKEISETTSNINSNFRLQGTFSRNVINQLSNNSTESNRTKLRWFTELLNSSRGLENLWDLVCVSRGSKESSLSNFYKSGIIHSKHLTKYSTATAKELQMAHIGKASVGSRGRDQALKQAASTHLLLGNMAEYCNLLIELGRWETAIALAPGVSLTFWQELVKKYYHKLQAEEDEKALPFMVARGDVENAVNFLSNRGDNRDALLASQSAVESNIEGFFNHASTANGLQHTDNVRREGRRLVSESCEKMSLRYFNEGDPCRAACCFVACDDINKAVNMLMQGNELELAACLCKLFSEQCQTQLHTTASLLSKRLEGQGHFNMAVKLLKSTVTINIDHWSPTHETCSRFDGNEADRINLYKIAGLPSPQECWEICKQCEADGDILDAMKWNLLSPDPSRGLIIGLNLMCDHISSSTSWSLTDDKLKKLMPIFCVRSSVLQNLDNAEYTFRLLALSAYLGSHKALSCGYTSIVTPLLEHAKAITERLEMKFAETVFPLSVAKLKKYLNKWNSFIESSFGCSVKAQKLIIPISCDNDHKTLTKMFLRTGINQLPSSGEVKIAGSNLPSHSDSHISTLTGLKVKGATFLLDQEKSSLCSLNEAVMWARVNQFSPTGDGSRIYPF